MVFIIFYNLYKCYTHCVLSNTNYCEMYAIIKENKYKRLNSMSWAY